MPFPERRPPFDGPVHWPGTPTHSGNAGPTMAQRQRYPVDDNL